MRGFIASYKNANVGLWAIYNQIYVLEIISVVFNMIQIGLPSPRCSYLDGGGCGLFELKPTKATKIGSIQPSFRQVVSRIFRLSRELV